MVVTVRKDLWMGEVTITRSGMKEGFKAILDTHHDPVNEQMAADLLLMWAIARPEPSFLVRPSEISVRMRDGETVTAFSDSYGKWTFKSVYNNRLTEVPPWGDDAGVYVISKQD